MMWWLEFRRVRWGSRQSRVGPERNEALVARGSQSVLHQCQVARDHGGAVGAYHYQEARVRVADEVVGVVAMRDADGARDEMPARGHTPSAIAQCRTKAQVRLRDPRIAPAHEALRLAVDVGFVEGIDVTPMRRVIAQHELNRRRGPGHSSPLPRMAHP